jgi:RNA polymerase sigma-70 factor (ECF subfamily)
MPGAPATDDASLVAALRAGDEGAFAELVTMLDPTLRRIARQYVSNDAAAADVVGDTWLAVVKGLDRFEGRSSLRTWIVRILMNQARTRGVRDHRSVPFSSVGPSGDDDLAGFDPDRFRSSGPGAGGWTNPPADWSTIPADRVEAAETRDRVQAAIDALPEQQRAVITLRDVEGWSAEEVCDALEVSEGNQRVLLHRARGAVRRALAEYLELTP